MRRKRKIIAYLLGMTLMLTSLPVQLFAKDTTNTPLPMTALVDTQTTTPGAIDIKPTKYIGDGYEVEFKVTNQWIGAFNGEFVLTNTSDKPLENWTLKFDFEHEITNMWNAQIITHEANSYIIKNQGYNQDIVPGSSVTVGFQANWTDKINIPQKYDLLIAKQEVGNTDYTIDFKVISDWGQAFNGEISITNNTEEIIEDWSLEFDFDRNIERFWTAEIVEHEGEHYIVKNAGYNANIAPGQTITLGFGGNPGNIDNEPMNYVLNQLGQEIDYTKDTDDDGLSDYLEKLLGTDSNNVDTDGDRLPDGYEYFYLRTDPLKVDTDNNEITDADEDIDKDGLTNIQEYTLETLPYYSDTDGDGLEDGEEINTYFTDPLLEDTDNDGLIDGEDILLGFNPLLEDTDGNGIIDSKEKVRQVFSQNINDQEKKEIIDVSVEFNCAGDIKKSVSINNIYNIDMVSSDVVGLIGVPVDITSGATFDEATISFTYDKSLLGETKEEDLAIMWYDEENQWFNVLDSQIDTNTSTISTVTTHFSKYLVVDKEQWIAAWKKVLDYGAVIGEDKSFDIAFVMDESGSIEGEPYRNAQLGINNFIDSFRDNDRATIISFDNSVNTRCTLTNEKEKLKKAVNLPCRGGGTNIGLGLQAGIDQLTKVEADSSRQKIIICITDGYGSCNVETICNNARNNNIKIFTIGLGYSVDATLLNMLATKTGGAYYGIKNSIDLLDVLYELKNGTVKDYDPTDNDDDGLPDIFETVGMRTNTGKIIYSNPERWDTDYDELRDGTEITLIEKRATIKDTDETNMEVGRYFLMYSHPQRIDSDYDGINDKDDPTPLDSHGKNRYEIVDSFEYKPGDYVVKADKARSDDVYGDGSKRYNYFQLQSIYSKTLANIYGGPIAGYPDASAALNRFLGRDNIDGIPVHHNYYNLMNFSSCINNTETTKKHFVENVNTIMNAAEMMVANNTTTFISTVNSPEGRKMATTLSTDAYYLGGTYSKNDINWWFTMGDAGCAMVAKVTRNDKLYEMELKYYANDFYDWHEGSLTRGGLVVDGDMYELHLAGSAKQYEIEALVITTITWSKGDRLSELYVGANMSQIKDVSTGRRY